MEQFKRQTAFKIWISDLLDGEFINSLGDMEPNYIVVKGKNVSRVNIIANVINKYRNEEGNYINIDLDDGSGMVSLKVWNEDTKILNNIKVADIVLVIARIRKFSNSIYLLPEIVKKLTDFDWFKLRKIELEKIWGKASEIKDKVKEGFTKEEIVKEEVIGVTQSLRQKLLNLIETQSEGILLSELISKSGLEAEKVRETVKELIKEGELFEPKENVLRVV